MHSRSNRILGLATLALGLGLTAALASAQQATFHLPFAVHWGRMVLESGDYKLSDTTGQSGSHLIYVSQRGHGRMVRPQSTEIQQPHSDQSSLELVNLNGIYFVTRYRSALTGQVFTFVTPKAAPETEMASAAVTSIPLQR